MKGRKPKIAISLDQPLLEMVDSKVDGNIIRSRSQAIEFYLRKGLRGESIATAVILLKGEHQIAALKQVKGESLIKHQLGFFQTSGVTTIYIITQPTKMMNDFLNEVATTSLNVEVVETEAKGNAEALLELKNKLVGNFLVMSGDILHDFEVTKLIKKHTDMDKLATMGLMTRSETKEYGTAILDGDFIVDFQEKPKHSATNIVNAGIYIFKSEIFELFDGVVSLERDLFPKLARMRQLIGYFTYGAYEHLG